MNTTVVTDIEGTTSPIAFVREVLFPYARTRLPEFVQARGQDPEVRRWLDAVAIDIAASPCDDAVIVETLQGWIDQDRKHTALKALQGMIWEAGYQRGDFTAPIYPDVLPALQAWHAAGHRLAVYSSGSVPAQKLLFAHTEAGDLTPLFSGFFDTETGGKRDPDSYRRIAQQLAQPAPTLLFLSDVVDELDAARAAGLRTTLLDRPQDYPQPRLDEAVTHGHPRVTSFAQISLPDA